ncbi:MAG: ATP-binding protein [Chloroflexota bacterium]
MPSTPPSERRLAFRAGEFHLEAGGVDRVHGLLQEFWAELEHRPAVASQRTRFEIAVVEIATNVLRYACEEADGFNSVHPRLELERLEAKLIARFTDRGRMLAAEVNLEACSMPACEELAEGGYGLPLARTCVDAVNYRRTPDGRNIWLLEMAIDSR